MGRGWAEKGQVGGGGGGGRGSEKGQWDYDL